MIAADGDLAAGITAIVLAGDRGEESPLLRESRASCKALVPVGGRPMVLRVIAALRSAAGVGSILLVGPREDQVQSCDALAALVRAGTVRWIESAATPCTSLIAALDVVAESEPVLVTTADHALLEAPVVEAFLAGAGTEADLACGVARHDAVMSAFPGARRTAHRLRDGGWCGCNLFRLGGGRARRGVEFWRRIEASRKRPWRAARLIGWGFLFRYATRRISLAEAVSYIASRMGLDARPVILEAPEAAVDVDSVADWHLVGQRLQSATEPR